MYEHFSERFPEQSGSISMLAPLSATLRAILADYEEISTWLAAQKLSEPRDPDELIRARNLARDLEKEILNCLERLDERIS